MQLRLFIITLALVASQAALAQEREGSYDMGEFESVKPGLMMPSEDDKPKNTGLESESGEPAADAGPSILPPVGLNVEQPLTMTDINKEYAAGNYAHLLPSLEMLVKNNHHAAEELYAIMCKYGQGVPKDSKKAFEYMSRAAEANRPLAQHHLGVMYFMGEGIDAGADPVRSLMWLHIAIVHYSDGPEKTRALQDRDSVLVRLSRREKERALEMARAWLEKKGEGHLLDMGR